MERGIKGQKTEAGLRDAEINTERKERGRLT